MHKRLIRITAALAVALVIATPSFADMKAFNAAVKAGDYKTAATEAESTWASWDKTREDTSVVAREFGFAALIAGRFELARQFGQFLVEKGATLTKPDDQPLTSAVLFRVADLRAGKSDDKLRALRAALVARSAAPGIDMTTALAWEALYIGSMSAGWEQAAKDASDAAAFYARDKNLLWRQRGAEVFAASTTFVGGRNRVTKGKNSYYDAMADVHDAIVADLDTATPAMRNQLWPLKWKAEAWAMAMESYLQSTYQQVDSNIKTNLQARALTHPQYGQFAEDPLPASLPVCEGKFEGKAMRYPASKEFKGLVGSVIARLETAVDGKVTKVEVMAAVPSDGFGADVVSTLSTWSYKPAKGIDTSLCRLQSKNQYYKVIFGIG